MIDFSVWETRRLSIDSLLLDKENPRLPEEMHNESQTSILHYLVNEFNVLDIAKSIVEHGFFVNEMPIVAKEGKRFFVVEGNRRVAALKLLRNPDLAPPRKKQTYSRLAENIDTNQWEKMPVYIAPSRDAAAPILLARHGSEMTSKWLRIMKMRFIAGDVLKGVDHEEIAKKLSINVAEVRTAALTILIREMIRESEIDEKNKNKFLSEKFQTSTLSRYIETRRFAELSGMQLIGTKLQFDIPKEDFLNVITYLCGEIKANRIKPHSHNEINKRNAFLDEIFKKITTGKQEKSSFTAKKSDIQNGKPPRKPRSTVKREKLISDTRKFNTGVKKLNELISEGQGMTVHSYPHAGGLLLRTILDLAVTRLFDINGAIADAYNSDGKVIGLTKRINKVVSEHSDWLPNKATCDKIKRFTSKDCESFIHIETLNDYVHGYDGKPTKDDLQNFWIQISVFLDQILEEE